MQESESIGGKYEENIYVEPFVMHDFCLRSIVQEQNGACFIN